MQLPLFNESFESAVLILKNINQDYIGIRFRIRNTNRFDSLRRKFRKIFPSASFQEIDGNRWWIVAASQRGLLEEFRQAHQLWLVVE